MVEPTLNERISWMLNARKPSREIIDPMSDDEICREIEALMKDRDGLAAFHRSVSEALNSGDGVYRP